MIFFFCGEETFSWTLNHGFWTPSLALVPDDQAGQTLNSTSSQGALSAAQMPSPGYFHTPFRGSLGQERDMVEGRVLWGTNIRYDTVNTDI